MLRDKDRKRRLLGIGRLSEHYPLGVYPTGKYLERESKRPRKEYEAICVCGFKAKAFSPNCATCKILGHQLTMEEY